MDYTEPGCRLRRSSEEDRARRSLDVEELERRFRKTHDPVLRR